MGSSKSHLLRTKEEDPIFFNKPKYPVNEGALRNPRQYAFARLNKAENIDDAEYEMRHEDPQNCYLHWHTIRTNLQARLLAANYSKPTTFPLETFRYQPLLITQRSI